MVDRNTLNEVNDLYEEYNSLATALQFFEHPNARITNMTVMDLYE